MKQYHVMIGKVKSGTVTGTTEKDALKAAEYHVRRNAIQTHGYPVTVQETKKSKSKK